MIESKIVPCMDANDLFVKLGFCPLFVRVTNLADGTEEFWSMTMGNDAGISRVAAGDRTANTDKGIKLVKFEEARAIDEDSDPTAVEPGNWYEADGIQITSDAVLLGDDNLLLIEAKRMDLHSLIVRAVHDGGDATNTYIQDGSVDFREAGVSSGWIVYNQTNGNYAYVGAVQRPSGNNKYCRCTLVDSNGDALTAADIDDDDVLFLFSKDNAGYPLSDIGAMT